MECHEVPKRERSTARAEVSRDPRGGRRERGGRGDGDRRQRGRGRVPDHAVHPDGRGVGRGRRRRQAERPRPQADLLRARGRARRRRRHGRHEHGRPARHQLLERPGHRVHARVAVRRRRQAAHLRAERRLPGDDQARAQRARRARRLPRRRRHRLLPALRQERAGGGRPQPHRAPHRRAVAEPGDRRPGRLPHEPRDRVGAAAGAGARAGVPGRPVRHHRVADARPALGLRREAPPDPRDVRLRLPGDDRGRPEPGQLRPGRRRPAALLLRPRGRADRSRAPGVRGADRPALRPRVGLPARGRRVRDRGPGLGRLERRGRRRLPARDSRPEGRRAQPDDVPALPGGPHHPAAEGQEGRRHPGAH